MFLFDFLKDHLVTGMYIGFIGFLRNWEANPRAMPTPLAPLEPLDLQRDILDLREELQMSLQRLEARLRRLETRGLEANGFVSKWALRIGVCVCPLFPCKTAPKRVPSEKDTQMMWRCIRLARMIMAMRGWR